MPFVTVNNQKIYYVATGTHGVPIIFVHGAAGSHLHWGFQIRALGELTHGIAIDLPGHGRSDPPGRNTIDSYRDVVLGLLDALQLDRAVIVGHSMGGAIAQALALSHPERVAGLGLVATGARLRVLPAILDGVLSPSDFVKTAEFVVDNSYGSSLDAQSRARAITDFCACPGQITHGDYLACNGFDIIPRVDEIRAPTVVICGAQDKMTPVKYSEFLTSKIIGARLIIVENAGHNVMIEQAESVNRALVEFVSGLRV